MATWYIEPCTSFSYLSRNQDSRKWAPLLTLNSFITHSLVTPKSCISVIHDNYWLMRWAVKKPPGRGRWNKEKTSSRVIIISLNRRWKEDVYLSYRPIKISIVDHWASSTSISPIKGEWNIQQSPWPPVALEHLRTSSTSPRGWAPSAALAPVTNKAKSISQLQHNLYVPLPTIIWMPHDRHTQLVHKEHQAFQKTIHRCVQMTMSKPEQ